MRSSLFGIAVVLAWISTAQPAVGQSPPAAPTGPVLGAGLGGGTGGLGFLGDLSISSSAGDFLVRGAGALDLEFLVSSAASTWDVGVLYGRVVRHGTAWLRVAAGPAHVNSEEVGPVLMCLSSCTDERVTSRALGLALQVDAAWALSRGFGLGVAGFADVNSARSFAGFAVGFYAGTLR